MAKTRKPTASRRKTSGSKTARAAAARASTRAAKSPTGPRAKRATRPGRKPPRVEAPDARPTLGTTGPDGGQADLAASLATEPDRLTAAAPPPASPPAAPPTQEAFRLSGIRVAAKEGSVLRTSRLRPITKAVLEPSGARAAAEATPVDVLPDDVLEVELEDGAFLWMTASEFRERFGGPPQRGAASTEVLRLPAFIDVLPGRQARGPVAWALKGAKVLGVDAVDGTARQIAHLIDTQKSATRPGLGLFRCELVTEGFALERASTVAATSTEPALIFIHGTGSSTFGGFGDLWSPRRHDELTAIRAKYGARVFTFEHATLGTSPIENALELAKHIPPGAAVHLVSHSRGGLVGELLCRARSDGRDPFGPRELRLFEADERASQRAQLEALGDVLGTRRFRVERFVRVACPALGTTLASGRLDRWLNVIGNIVGRAKPKTPLAEAFGDLGDFLLAVVKERTDPRSLPGLEAMMPDSPLVKLVNWPANTVEGHLAVIAGDIEPDAKLAKLLVWVSDRFYGGDHDLVVNTLSMVGGARRAQERAVVAWHKGPHITHFNYFENDLSARQMVSALVDDTLTADFEPFDLPDSGRIARAAKSSAEAEPRPTVFVLPGIMGSELAVGREKVWLDLARLLLGGLKKLRLGAPVRPTNLLDRIYGELIDHLSATHRVEVFPYDWRLPLEEEADRLSGVIRRALDDSSRAGQPIRILAHSMGGLIARTFIARHPDVWRRIVGLRGSRLVMLGTPNRGAHAIIQLLVGQASTLKKLAALDVTSGQEELLAIISRWPGVLSMIPKDAEDYFAVETWQRYHAAAGDGWVMPAREDLARAHKLREVLDTAAIEPAHMIYVAGSGDATLESVTLETGGVRGARLQFYGTSRGDGTVTWDNGLLPGVPTYFMDVEHGDLASFASGFPALLDLLASGTTTRLSTSPPVPRGASDRFEVPEPTVGLYPNEETLTAAVLGGGSRKRRVRQPVDAVVRVAVAHGNLGFARHAVAVGHYTGDTIISAERHLDRRLGGALSARLDLGRYPGPLESSAVFINPLLSVDPHVTPKGAIVVGLGQVGRLTMATLTRTFTKALLEFALQWCAATPGAEADGQGAGPTRIALTTLLIGTGAAGIDVDDSVYALVRGVGDANRALQNARKPSEAPGSVPQITDLEIIELYEDRALQALESVLRLVTDPEFRGRVVTSPTLETRPGGLTRLQFEESDGWWQRLQILGGRDDVKGPPAPLRFASFTQNARTEVSLLPTQRALVDRFVSQSISSTIANTTAARTLFQLLLPNELKDRAPDQDNLVLLLDETAATYPWELLEDDSDAKRRPFAIQHGLLRQLETVEYRRAILNATDDAALVIGDPVSQFDELPGAQAEAAEVERRLQADMFAVSAQIRPRGDQVVSALYERPYRVLHLAGHGVFSPPTADRDKTIVGMIIGENMLLTPAEIEQMRTVPELVFLNCCHLGHVTPSPNKLAANLAAQFIRMGVRAVVAAGWAVDDRAASTFASEFYLQFLGGDRFGDAVHKARKATYERHLGTNTWGAYQCYGDPDFRLRRSGKMEPDKPFRFVTPSQAVNEARNFRERLRTKGGQGFEWELKRLHDIVTAVTEREWLERSDVRAALGLAFGEAEEFDLAIDHLRRAIELDPGNVTVGTIEQLANFEIRAALERRAAGHDAKAVSAEIAHGFARLQQLSQYLAGTGLKLGRGASASGHGLLTMLGSAYKRKALVADGDVKESLRLMSAYYKSAMELALENKKDDADYPRLNWVAAEIASDWQTSNRSPLVGRSPEFGRAIDASRVSLKKRLTQGPNFWLRIMLIETDLLTLLGELQGDAVADERMTKGLASIERAYRNARGTGSPRELASALDQLEFFAVMADHGGRQALGRRLQALRRSLLPVATKGGKKR